VRHNGQAMNVAGVSIAGVETCIEVPSLGVLFDLGRCTRNAVNVPVVLVSHGHLDHIGAIAQHAARRAMMKMEGSTYVVPEAIRPNVEFPLGKGRWVRPFRTFHRVPSQGYSIWERRHRLRDEFRDVPGARLAELKRQGVEIEQRHDVALVSFTGDTRIEALEENPELQQTETLVMECTFLDARVTVESARAMGHIHLDEIVQRKGLLPGGEIVLAHFSARYDRVDIERSLMERLPEDCRTRINVLSRSASS
jgi:ribonuclease Z